MSILCVICSDLLTKSENIFSTHCGHVFHFDCLIQWVERSKTCPQCREKVRKREIHKLYLSVTNETTPKPSSSSSSHTNSIIEDLRFQMLLKDKNVNYYSTKSATLKKQNISLVKEVEKLESIIRQKDSDIYEYKEQIKQLQEQNIGYKNAKEEVARLKRKNEELRSIQMLIDAPLEDVKDIVERNRNPNILLKYVFVMKKKMLLQQKKIKSLRMTVKNLQDDLVQMGTGHLLKRQNKNVSNYNTNEIALQQNDNKQEETCSITEDSDNNVTTKLQIPSFMKSDNNSKTADIDNNDDDGDIQNIIRNIAKKDTELNSSTSSTKCSSTNRSMSLKKYELYKIGDHKKDIEFLSISSSSEEQKHPVQNRKKTKKMKSERIKAKRPKVDGYIDLTRYR